jgi:hypothetical protein
MSDPAEKSTLLKAIDGVFSHITLLDRGHDEPLEAAGCTAAETIRDKSRLELAKTEMEELVEQTDISTLPRGSPSVGSTASAGGATADPANRFRFPKIRRFFHSSRLSRISMKGFRSEIAHLPKKC